MAHIASAAEPLTSFDIPILGLSASPDPTETSIPKNTDSAIRLVVRAGDRTLTATEVTAFLGPGFEVRGDLSGPGIDRPLTLPEAGASLSDPLLLPIPAMPIGGDYLLSNLRIARNGVTLLEASPSKVPVKIIEQILITSVKTRPLTMDEIRDKGIVLDSDDYVGFEFTLGMATDSRSVSFSLPVVFDRAGVPVPSVIEPPPAPGRQGISLEGAPDPLIIPALLEGDVPPLQLPEFEKQMRTPSGERIRIPSVVVIPGNVGYLKQFFSAQLFVANGAPLGSGLTVRQVMGTVRLPPGADLVLGTADDPLALPETTRGMQPTTMQVKAVGPDGQPATADDVETLGPTQQGQTEFLIRGEKEGYHEVNFDISALLEGLPIGPVTVKGQAKGGVLVRNPFFNMSFTIPSVVRKGETFSIYANVSNIGQGMANDVHVTLDGSRMAGATLVGEPTQIIKTLRTGDSASLEYKFISQRTGQVSATYLGFDSASAGGLLKFTLGVGERGVALSPDTLVMPNGVDLLPTTVTDAAMRVLGQAWSIVNAPNGTLPADVIRISRTVATQKALALAEAGLRAVLGQPVDSVVRDLLFDFYGGEDLDPGFDQLLRTTAAGHGLAQAIGVALGPAMATAGGALAYGSSVDGVAVSGPDTIGIIAGGTASTKARLTDSQGQISASFAEAGALPKSQIPGTVWVPLAGSSLLGLVSELSSVSYSLDLNVTSGGTLDLAVTQPRGNGSFNRAVLSAFTVVAGTQVRLTINRYTPDVLTASVDADGDGEFESTQDLTLAQVNPPGASLLSATVVGPETIDGASPFGMQVAAVFDRVVDASSAAEIARYTIPRNSLLGARRQLSGRIVFATLSQPEGPYIPTTFTASGIRDQRGIAGPSQTVSLAARLEDPGAVVSGRVIGPDGAPLTTGKVIYENSSNWQCREMDGSPLVGMAAANLDAQGRYEFRYVRQDFCGQPWSMVTTDPRTGAVHRVSGYVRSAGEQIVLDIALLGQGSVTGIVRDLNGLAVGGAKVSVLSVNDPQSGGLATSDGEGRYTVYGITVGPVSVRAVKGSNVGQAAGTIARSGGSADVDVTIDRGAGSVAGRVLIEEGASTRPAMGLLVAYQVGGTAVAVVNTDNTGAFIFTDVPVGAFKLWAALNTASEATTTGVLAAGDQLTNVDLVIRVPDLSTGGGGTTEGYGTVRGLVRMPDGSPAAGVVVSVGQRGILSASDGSFEIPGVQVQNGVAQTVLARSRDGLRSGTASATVNVTGQVVVVAIVLSGLGSAEFTVLSPAGTPLAGLQVALLDQCDAPCGCAAKTTNVDGKVVFTGLPIGQVTARVVRPGTAMVDVATASASVTGDGEIAKAILRFKGAGMVSGVVLDPQGRPAYGADVVLVSYYFNSDICGFANGISQRVRTSTDGAFSFQNVNLGPVSVTASQTFFPRPTTRSGTLTTNGQELTFTMPLSEGVSTISGELSGTVYLPDGKTPAGAGIEITATGALPDVVVLTDAQGHYRFAKIFPEGGYTLTARDTITGAVARSSVYLRAAQDATADLRLLGRGTVRVRVVDAADQPVANAFVRLTQTGFPGQQLEGAADQANQGLVTFENVFEGSLSAEASDVYARGGRASGVLAGQGATVELKVRLSMTGTVTGIFVAPDGITPVPFGAISLTAGGRLIGQTTTQGSGADVGKFRFEYVPAGPVRVDAQDPATARTGAAAGTIETQGQVLDLRVRAQGVGTVAGSVTSNGSPVAGVVVEVVAGSLRASTMADATGGYRVVGVPEGRVVVTASLGNGFLSGTASGTLTGEGAVLRLDVALRSSGHVDGAVVKADGISPASASSVSITVGGTGGGTLSTVTDSQGKFSFDRVPAGLASISVDVLGSIDRGKTSVEVPAGGSVEAKVTLHGVGSLRGMARDSAGWPTVGSLVVTGQGDIAYTQTATAGSDGGFFLPELLAGPFSVSLKVVSSGFTLYGTASGEIKAGQENAIEVRVQSSGLVRGRVLRADGVAPAFGAEVTLSLDPNRGSNILYTGEDGRFEVRGVPLGAFSLRVADALSGGVALLGGRSIANNGQVEDVGDIVLDESPIEVVSFSPVDGATQIPVNQPIVVTFTDPLGGTGGITVATASSSVVATPTLSADRRTVTLTGAWPDASEIIVTASTSVRDIYNRRLLHPASSRFFTVDLSGPKVQSIEPADKAIEVPADTTILVTFNEPLDLAQDVAGIVALGDGTASLAGATVRSGDRGLLFSPAQSLPPNTTFTVTVNGARDASGNTQTTAFVSRFATHDTQAPLLTMTQPAPGTWTKNPRPGIVFALSDGLAGIEPLTGSLSIAGSPVVPTVNASSLSHTPSAALPDGKHAVVATVADRAGNQGTGSGAVWIDTVAPAPVDLAGIAQDAVLSGSVSVSAVAPADQGVAENSGVGQVRILDGTNLVTTLSAPDFSGLLDTTKLSEGRHQLKAVAVDRAGNVGQPGTAIDIIVNNLVVGVTITEPPVGKRVRDSVLVRATASEPIAQMLFAVGGATAVDDTPPFEAVLDLTGEPEGSATLSATAVDLVGQMQTATRAFVIDRTPPVAPNASLVFAEPPDNGKSLVYGQAGAVEGGATVNLTNQNNGATASALAAADGTFSTLLTTSVGDTVSLSATDIAGNTGPAVTVTVRSTTSLPPATASLTFLGRPVDRVGDANLAPDDTNDAVFELSFALGGVTRQLSFIDLSGPGLRSTRVDVSTKLGVSGGTVVANQDQGLGGAFINAADGTVASTLTGTVSLLLYASDAGLLQAGATYTATAAFTNGGRYVGTLTIAQFPTNEVTSATWSVENRLAPLNPDEPLPSGTNEVTSAVWSVQNSTAPLNPDEPLPGGSNEVSSAVWSVANNITPLNPDVPLPAGTNEVTSVTWSVQNLTTPLNPDEPLPGGLNEVASPLWSVENNLAPLNPDEPLPAGSNETSSAMWSAQNLITPLNPDEPLPAGLNESSSPIWSVNNDPNAPPGGQGPDAGADASVYSGQDAEPARDSN